jgi:hypothetical protein
VICMEKIPGGWGTTGRSSRLFPSKPHMRRRRLGSAELQGRWNMAMEKLAARPTTKREADVAALKLFCLFGFILVALILAGIL